MPTCDQVADYFLARVDSDAGDLMSNLKLQKLVYYAQGAHLALYSRPLFHESIEAWAHGPVVPSLYQRFKRYGTSAIDEQPAVDFAAFSQEELELLEEVHDVYGQFSAAKLRDMTHEEEPWARTPRGGEISHDALKAFFRTRLVEA